VVEVLEELYFAGNAGKGVGREALEREGLDGDVLACSGVQA
jgi:hypothetical protein